MKTIKSYTMSFIIGLALIIYLVLIITAQAGSLVCNLQTDGQIKTIIFTEKPIGDHQPTDVRSINVSIDYGRVGIHFHNSAFMSFSLGECGTFIRDNVVGEQIGLKMYLELTKIAIE